MRNRNQTGPATEYKSGLDILANAPQEAQARAALAKQYDEADGLARLRQARAERDRNRHLAARRYVPPENEYQMAGLRLQAQAQGEDFAAKEHPPGTTLVSRPPVLDRGFALAIVEASRKLTSDQKRLFRRYVELDRPKGYKTGGCFEKVPTTARRLGVNAGSVKRNRRILCELGLLVSTPEGITPIRWFPTLPPWVNGIRPAGVANGKATDAWIMAEATQLDAVLSARLEEMKMAKQAKGAERPRKVRADDSNALDQICTPESHDLYPEGAQIVPGEGTNCTPRLPRFMPLHPCNAVAA